MRVHTTTELEQRRAARGDVGAVSIGRRHFERGDEFTVRGEAGTFLFVSARVVDDVVLWVDCFANRKGHPRHARSFYPQAITAKKRPR